MESQYSAIAAKKRHDFVRALRTEPPVPCEFAIGDTVTYTNEYDVVFPGMKVIGFAADDSFYGRFIHLDSDAYWFPVTPESLTLEQTRSSPLQ